MSEATADVNRLVIRRVFSASPSRVFDAWTKPEHLAHWWRCRPDWGTTITDVDLRVGGFYRLGMYDPEKQAEHVAIGEFRVVDPPRRLIYTWTWEPPGMDTAGSLVTVDFLPHDEGTELVLTHERFPTREFAESHTAGWTAAIGILEQYLAS